MGGHCVPSKKNPTSPEVGGDCVSSKKSTIKCSSINSDVFPFTLTSSQEEVVLIAHSLPKLRSSARMNTHQQLLLPPVNETCMPCQLTHEEADPVK